MGWGSQLGNLDGGAIRENDSTGANSRCCRVPWTRLHTVREHLSRYAQIKGNALVRSCAVPMSSGLAPRVP